MNPLFAQLPTPTPVVDPTTANSLVSGVFNSQFVTAIGIPGFFALIFLGCLMYVFWTSRKPSTTNTKLLIAIFQVQSAQHHQSLDVAQGLLDVLACQSKSLNADVAIQQTQQALNQNIVTPDIMQLVLDAQAKGNPQSRFVSFPHQPGE